MWVDIKKEQPRNSDVFLVAYREKNNWMYTFSWYDINSNAWNFNGYNLNIKLTHWCKK